MHYGKLGPEVIDLLRYLSKRGNVNLNTEAVTSALARLKGTPLQRWLPGLLPQGGEEATALPLGRLLEEPLDRIADRASDARFKGFGALLPGAHDRSGSWHEYGGDLVADATVDVERNPVDELLRRVARALDTDVTLKKHGIRRRGWQYEGD